MKFLGFGGSKSKTDAPSSVAPAAYQGGSGSDVYSNSVDSKSRGVTLSYMDSGAVVEQVAGGTPYQVKAPDVTPAPAWQTKGIAPDLGGMGGSDVTAHGNALALRDSRDGTKFIAQMNDGTFQSIDKTTGAVTAAGTWGDGHGGGIAASGVGGASAVAATAADAYSGNINLNDINNDPAVIQAQKDEAVRVAAAKALTDAEAAKAATAADAYSGQIDVSQIDNDPVVQQSQKEEATRVAADSDRHAAMLKKKDADLFGGTPDAPSGIVNGDNTAPDVVDRYMEHPFTLPDGGKANNIVSDFGPAASAAESDAGRVTGHGRNIEI